MTILTFGKLSMDKQISSYRDPYAGLCRFLYLVLFHDLRRIAERKEAIVKLLEIALSRSSRRGGERADCDD